MVHKKSLTSGWLGKAKMYTEMIGDINVNHESYKDTLVEQIESDSSLPNIVRGRLLATAKAIKANSFIWKKQWDRGKIFEM